ncbi:MAG TPA: CHAD domain-containing protein [Vicinamibacterales bacterium]|nr:CHAD domain-containing protein [Vicinamibacterales bacterium]
MNVRHAYDGLWRKRLDALDKVWPQFVAGDTEALHKVRVASRRIREALPVVGVHAPSAKVKKLRRKMRRLTRFLGPIRELDVELGLIEKRLAGRDARSALSVVRREVAARRQALRHKLKDGKQVGDLGKLRRKLEKVSAPKKQEPEDAWRAALAARLLRRAKRLKEALDEAGPLYAPERIHAVRVATKKMRYALEIAGEAGLAAAKPQLKGLKREQELLGHLHDLQSLLKHVQRAQASPRVGSRLAELTAYADTLERECRTLHAEFVEGRDALFTCAHDVRHVLVPALTTNAFRQARVTHPQRRARGRMAKRA